MHRPFTFLLIVVAAGAVAVYGGHSAAKTPAAQFWEQALPGTPMPEAIADLIQKGIDHSPLVEHYTASPSISACTLSESTCSPQKVAETGIFFHETQLRPGSTMTLSFPAEAAPAILPHDIAEKAPFANLDDNAMRMLGADGDGAAVWAAAASELTSAGLPRQQYAVVAAAPAHRHGRYVYCHTMQFPYAVYLCHVAHQSGYRAYKVLLTGLRDGSALSMSAFCHLDTAGWNPAHPAFEVLHTKPSGAPVCHFMRYGNMVFDKKATRA
ncbi:hypothetical protein EJB05_57618, partial [Eragrostis curvula]